MMTDIMASLRGMMTPLRGMMPEWAVEWPQELNLPLGGWASDFAAWAATEGAVSRAMLASLDGLEQVLLDIPWTVAFIVLAALAWVMRGKWAAVAVAVSALLIGLIDPQMWDYAISTLSLAVLGAVFCLILGVPLGILAAKSARVRNVIRPVFDCLEGLPAFVHLVPAILLFRLGDAAALLAVVLYAIPPIIRLTDEGLRGVNEDVSMAAHAMGAGRMRRMMGVKIPMAMSGVRLGFHQTAMMALGMAVVASVVGAGGLGGEALSGLQRGDAGRALEAGVAIVLLAIIVDRMTRRGARSRRGAIPLPAADQTPAYDDERLVKADDEEEVRVSD